MKQENLEVIKNGQIIKVFILDQGDLILYLDNHYNITNYPKNNSIAVLLLRSNKGKRFFIALNNKIKPKFKGYYLKAKKLNPGEEIELLDYKIKYRVIEYAVLEPIKDITTNSKKSTSIIIYKKQNNSKLIDKLLIIFILIFLLTFILRFFF